MAIVLAAWIGITSVTNQGCEIGLAIGLVSGVVIGGAYLVDFGTGSVVAQLDPPFALTLSGLFMAPALAGVLAARGTANPVAGGVAGFWAGLIGALVVIVVAIAAMQLFAGRLEAGPWLHDPNVAHMRNCSGAVGARLGSCETGDIVGGLANGLLNAPTIGLVVGLIAGALMTRARSTLANVDLRALIGPISLCAAFFVLSTLEIRLNLW